MTRLQIAGEQLAFTRRYTADHLANVPEHDWFRMPTEGVTHIAWQVGHLAMANYRLVLERVRGPRPADEQLISADFLQRFGRGSVPVPDPQAYPSIAEIKTVFHNVHAASLLALQEVCDADLELPPFTPHRLFNTRWQALMWCSQHELLHAGQIGLLRRLHGQPTRW